jgi:DNA gyrase subunit A
MPKQTNQSPGSHPGRVIDIDVKSEMEGSFLEYAYSVIYARALPDARDGLKPVHRRILHQMAEMGLRPDRGHVKSARVVGEVMGKLHPHGDGAIYDALVRMAQSFSMRLPLIDGHGNFGSLDSGPAAMRYSEARLSKAAMAMVEGTEEETVDFGANYDGALTEPSVLPAAFPNLLVNGATGIAVGMATNMAPHNLNEVVAAARHLLGNPNATLADLMQYVPGPDLPTGGKIVGLDGIRDAYESGRGSFKMRATTRIENVSAKKRGIVVTELPYSVGPEKVLEKIADLVRAKKLQGISDVIDLTDGQNGTRLVIEIKNGFHPEAILEDLFRLTPMEETFSINAVALVHGRPQTLGLKSLLEVYLGHRVEVTRRRSEYRRRRASERLHLVDGLLIAIVDIDEVIQLIRASDDANTAKLKLIEICNLTETQAIYILDMPLRRLTKFSALELSNEQTELRTRIQVLTTLLENEKSLRALVSEELAIVAKNFGTPRRTVLLESSGVASISIPLEVADGPTRVLLSATGLIARTTEVSELSHEIWRLPRARHDVITSSIITTAHGDVGIVTSLGKIHRLRAIDLPVIPPLVSGTSLAGGAPLAEILRLEKGERAIALATLAEEGAGIALATAQGIVKRVQPEVLVNKNEWEIISLKSQDEVVGATQLLTGNEQMVFVTDDAQLLHFNASIVRPQGRAANGIAGIVLSEAAKVIYFTAFMPSGDDVVVTISAPSDALPGTTGSLKISDFAEFPSKGRATGGVRAHRFLKGEDQLVNAYAGPTPIRAAAANGTAIEVENAKSKRDASGTPVPGPISVVAGPIE